MLNPLQPPELLQISRELANSALDISAVRFSPGKPFLWASGYRMPIYSDTRLFLGNAAHRALIARGFKLLIESHGIRPEVIAGTATAGISPATTLADALGIPLCYVRDKPKDHGLMNRIEGVIPKGRRVVLVEDVISTGGSSLSAVGALREIGASVNWCLAIFSYNFPEAVEQFKGIHCGLTSVLTYEVLVQAAAEKKYLSASEQEELARWRADPFHWKSPS